MSQKKKKKKLLSDHSEQEMPGMILYMNTLSGRFCLNAFGLIT